jgi:hypothetical protein
MQKIFNIFSTIAMKMKTTLRFQLTAARITTSKKANIGVHEGKSRKEPLKLMVGI